MIIITFKKKRIIFRDKIKCLFFINEKLVIKNIALFWFFIQYHILEHSYKYKFYYYY